MPDKPSVLFVCVHNAGRSQMAAGYLSHLSGGAIEVRSAGSEPADKINPVAVQAMAEEGIDNVESMAHGDIVELMSSTRISAAQLVDFVAGKVLDAAGVSHTLFTRWSGELGHSR